MRTMSGGYCPHFDCSNRNSFGYCSTTVCINELYKQEQWGLPSIKTNADYIRSLTDEELAYWLYSLNDEHCDSVCPPNKPACMVQDTCMKCWIQWLRDEVR